MAGHAGSRYRGDGQQARDTEGTGAAKPGAEDVDFIGINEIVASAGAGAAVMDERIVGRMKFGRTWLRKHGLRADHCRIIRVSGESMEPTLADGAAILVNLESREPKDGKIFVVRIDDDLVVKRLLHDAATGWLVQSDNPDRRTWPTRPFPDEADDHRGDEVDRAELRIGREAGSRTRSPTGTSKMHSMTPYELITKWRGSRLTERCTPQEDFRPLDEPAAAEGDEHRRTQCRDHCLSHPVQATMLTGTKPDLTRLPQGRDD